MVSTLEKYLSAQKLQIKDNIARSKEFDINSLHDFRVGLKKTRTMLNFIHFWMYNESEKTVIYRQIRPIFKRTGKIRELHVHEELLPVISKQTGLDLDFLTKKISYQLIRNKVPLTKELRVFEKSYPRIFKNINQQVKNSVSLKQRTDSPRGYQIRLERKIQKQLRSSSPNLHLIRKLIKQKIYVFDAFQESELLSFYKEFRAEWKILESSMGKWHDQLCFLEWLNKGLKWKRLDDDQYKTMLNLIAWLKSSTTRMEEQLIQSVPRLNV